LHGQRGQRARIEKQFHQGANNIKPSGANKVHPAAFASPAGKNTPKNFSA
jgi:hypothetical protein